MDYATYHLLREPKTTIGLRGGLDSKISLNPMARPKKSSMPKMPCTMQHRVVPYVERKHCTLGIKNWSILGPVAVFLCFESCFWVYFRFVDLVCWLASWASCFFIFFSFGWFVFIFFIYFIFFRLCFERCSLFVLVFVYVWNVSFKDTGLSFEFQSKTTLHLYST